MAEEPEEPKWYRIQEPPIGIISTAQETAVRDYAEAHGYETLRGFHWYLKRMDWDYYDILKMVYL